MSSEDDAIPAQTPSRSQRRREALAVLAIARAALDLPGRVLARLPLPDPIRQSIERARRIPSHIARKRETGYLAKLLRADPEAAAALGAAIGQPGQDPHGGRLSAHRAERWAERLIREGETALARLCQAHPQARSLPLKPLLLAARANPGSPGRESGEASRRLRRALSTLFAEDRAQEEE